MTTTKANSNYYLNWVCPRSGEHFCDSLSASVAGDRTVAAYIAWARNHGVERYSVIAKRGASPDACPIVHYRGEPLSHSLSVAREAAANLIEGASRWQAI